MNYEQARQIGPNGPAPGKWNWTNSNDSISEHPYTASPCAWPDFDWKSVKDPLQKVTPTGRERCDHDTKVEAERHYWEHQRDSVRWDDIDPDAARRNKRIDLCEFPDCTTVATKNGRTRGGWESWSSCDEHANAAMYETLHPFSPNTSITHS